MFCEYSKRCCEHSWSVEEIYFGSRQTSKGQRINMPISMLYKMTTTVQNLLFCNPTVCMIELSSRSGLGSCSDASQNPLKRDPGNEVETYCVCFSAWSRVPEKLFLCLFP